MNPNPASSSSTEETLVASAPRIVVGVDPGLDEHGVAVLAAGTCARLERRKFPNTVAGMESLVERLTECFVRWVFGSTRRSYPRF